MAVLAVGGLPRAAGCAGGSLYLRGGAAAPTAILLALPLPGAGGRARNRRANWRRRVAASGVSGEISRTAWPAHLFVSRPAARKEGVRSAHSRLRQTRS